MSAASDDGALLSTPLFLGTTWSRRRATIRCSSFLQRRRGNGWLFVGFGLRRLQRGCRGCKRVIGFGSDGGGFRRCQRTQRLVECVVEVKQGRWLFNKRGFHF